MARLMNTAVSQSRRKQRRRHFQADSNKRRLIMSAPLSKELQQKYGVKSMPVRKEDEVRIVKGGSKNQEGKISNVYRRKWIVHVERVTRQKANGTEVSLPVNPNNCVITKLKLDKDRELLLKQRMKKGTKTEEELELSQVD